MLRILGNKVQRLIKIKVFENDYKNIDELIEESRPIIFWKEKPIIKKQITIWKLSDLINKRVDVMLDESVIEDRMKKIKIKYPDNQTPWQEISRRYTGQLSDGACLDTADDYFDGECKCLGY